MLEGVAKPRVIGLALERAARLRSPCERFKASLRDAMAELWRMGSDMRCLMKSFDEVSAQKAFAFRKAVCALESRREIGFRNAPAQQLEPIRGGT